jgi:hypothetical protein
MRRETVARSLACLAFLGYLGTAALHGSGYDWVRREAGEVPGFLGAILPGLWLAFSFDLIALGIIVGILALRPRDIARPILLVAGLCPLSVAGLCPLSVAGLQLAYIGYIPPTGILIALGAVHLGRRGGLAAAQPIHGGIGA